MCPEQANVFVIEDKSSWQSTISYALDSAGHKVILFAGTKEDALAAIPRLRGLRIQVITLDENLGHDRSDGREVLSALRVQVPEMKIVGMAGDIFEGVDINVGKDNCQNLAMVVTKL